MQNRAIQRLFLTTVASCLAGLSFLAAPSAIAQDKTPAAKTEKLPSAKKIFKRFVEVTGGQKSYSKYTSRTSSGTWELAGANITGKVVVYQAAPAKLLVEIDVPGIGQMKQGFNGTVGWTLDPMQGPMLATGKQLAQAKREAVFNMLANIMEYYKSATTEEKVDFGGEECYRVELVSEDGDISHAFYSIESGLFTGMSMKAATPLGEVETTSTFSEYKEFGGIQVATVNVISAMGQTQTITLTSIDFDNVDPSVFDLPAAIETLVKAGEEKKEKPAEKPAS